MATLWNKGKSATRIVEDFTVGKDRELDLRLAVYDVTGSMAHVKMLGKTGLLSGDETEVLIQGLKALENEIRAGQFTLGEDVEDIHSQVELLLTQRLGEVGKKIHSGRSRNDQVLVDLRLFFRDELLKLREETLELFDLLQSLSGKYSQVLLPGYTHTQIAMPSSFGMWFGAYSEALVDNMYECGGCWKITNRNPLGSAAGYGNSFPLDREMTTELLGFDSPVVNSVAAQLGRGAGERCIASAIGGIALTLNKFASDCIAYMCPNFGFIKFPDELTTGSSIMPHKKNPDVWEIIRGRCNMILSAQNTVAMMCSNTIHGYHRDWQLLKEVIFPALEYTHQCLEMTSYMLRHIEINEHILDNPIYKYMFTVEEVNRRTLAGVPFRDAYKEVGIEVNEGRFRYGGSDGRSETDGGASLTVKDLNHTHLGSIGNLANDRIKTLMDEASAWGKGKTRLI